MDEADRERDRDREMREDIKKMTNEELAHELFSKSHLVDFDMASRAIREVHNRSVRAKCAVHPLLIIQEGTREAFFSNVVKEWRQIAEVPAPAPFPWSRDQVFRAYWHMLWGEDDFIRSSLLEEPPDE